MALQKNNRIDWRTNRPVVTARTRFGNKKYFLTNENIKTASKRLEQHRPNFNLDGERNDWSAIIEYQSKKENKFLKFSTIEKINKRRKNMSQAKRRFRSISKSKNPKSIKFSSPLESLVIKNSFVKNWNNSLLNKTDVGNREVIQLSLYPNDNLSEPSYQELPQPSQITPPKSSTSIGSQCNPLQHPKSAPHVNQILKEKNAYIPVDKILQDLVNRPPAFQKQSAIIQYPIQKSKTAKMSKRIENYQGGDLVHSAGMNEFGPVWSQYQNEQCKSEDFDSWAELPYLTEHKKTSFISTKLDLLSRFNTKNDLWCYLNTSKCTMSPSSSTVDDRIPQNGLKTKIFLPKLDSEEYTKIEPCVVKVKKRSRKVSESTNDGYNSNYDFDY